MTSPFPTQPYWKSLLDTVWCYWSPLTDVTCAMLDIHQELPASSYKRHGRSQINPRMRSQSIGQPVNQIHKHPRAKTQEIRDPGYQWGDLAG